MNNYNGLLYIFDREEKLLSILNNEASEGDIFFDDEFKKELNGEWSYKFSVDMSKTKDLMLEYNKVGFYDRAGNFQLFVIHDIEDNISYEAIRTVYCLHDFQSLNENIIEEGKIVGDAKTALNLALKDSNYVVGIVSNTEEQVKNLSMITVLDAIHSIAETYNLETYYRLELDETKTKIVKRYVDLVERLGSDTGLTFNFSLNIESIKRKINNNFFTVLYGRGKQLKDETYATFANTEWKKGDNPCDKPKGQIWVSDEEAIKKYGERKGIYSNENISISDTLLRRTWEKLQKVNRPKINYEASVYDLSSITGYENLKINLGDRFNILDDIYNINEDVRVIVEYESILDETSKRVELGDPVACLTDDSIGESYEDIEEDDDIGEDGEGGSGEGVEGENTLPQVPVVTAEGYFATVSITWTFENKSYYTYELYASDVKGFNPTEDDKIFEGKASAFLHEVNPSEIWYYKVRAKNGHGRYTDFSKEVSAETLKITDGTKYFESMAIKDALIGELNLDRGWVGELKGNYIDAKQLSVTNGNGERTLDIDSYGNVNLNVASLKISSSNVATENYANNQANASLLNAKTYADNVGNSTLTSANTHANNVANTAQTNAINTAKDYTNTKITDVKTEIKVTTDSITQRVSSTENTLTATTNKLDNLKIGGRNILRCSSFESNDTAVGWVHFVGDTGEGLFGTTYKHYNNTNNATTHIDILQQYIYTPNNNSKYLKANTWYTFSFYAKGAGKVRTYIYPSLIDTNIKGYCDGVEMVLVEDGNKDWVLTNDWVKYTYSFKTVSSIPSVKQHALFRIYGGNEVYICAPKFEEGNKATDWTPAPEDLSDEINQKITDVKAEIKVTTDSITQRVSSTESKLVTTTNKLDNLKVGGTNLLTNTKTFNGWHLSRGKLLSDTYLGFNIYYYDYKTNSGVVTSDFGLDNILEIEPNTQYTLSFYVKGTGKFYSYLYPDAIIKAENCKGNTWSSTNPYDGGIINTINNPGTWERFWLTWTSGADVSGKKSVIVARHYEALGDSELYICGVKLEKGNKATDWTPAPEDIENDISNLETRISSAESKITENAITNTVKMNFYTKPETESAIISKGYQTASQVQQTVDKLQIKFEESGGYNLIRNSIIKNGSTFWSAYDHRNGSSSILSISNRNDKWTNYTECLQIRTTATNVTSADGGYLQKIRVERGKKYTLRYLIAGHRSTKIVMITDSTNSVTIAYKTHGEIDGGSSAWEEGILRFTATEDYIHIRVGFRSFTTDPYIWVRELCLSEGDIPLAWSPHPSEIYDGITAIDKDGITVSQSNIDTTTTMNANGFYINKADKGDIFRVDSNGVYLRTDSGARALECIASNGNRDMLLYGGQVCIYNNMDKTFIGTMGSVLNNANTFKGTGFLLGKDCTNFVIGRDSNWNDILTNRSPNPTHYLNIDFSNKEIVLGSTLKCSDVNMQGGNLTNTTTGKIMDIHSYGFYAYNTGKQMFKTNGYDMFNGANWDWQGHNILSPVIIGGSYGYSVVNDTEKEKLEVNSTEKEKLEVNSTMDTISEIKIVQSLTKNNSRILDVSNVTNKDEIMLNEDNVDLCKLVTLLIDEVKKLKFEMDILKNK